MRSAIISPSFSPAFISSCLLSLLLLPSACFSKDLDQNCCPSDEESVVKARLESAWVLTQEAKQLSAMNEVLTRWSKCLASLTKETPHADIEHGQVSTDRGENTAGKESQFKVDSQNFQQLLMAYQEARREYLQHKLLYDQHVTAFHNQPSLVPSVQPSSGQTQLPVISAPTITPMKLKVTDACSQLMTAEAILTGTERELAAMLNYLRAVKGKLDSESYFQSWTGLQSMGATLQRQVVEYGNAVILKQRHTEEQMHDVEQAAITTGNYQQSISAYQEVQRCSALNNDETRRAHMHTIFASSVLSSIAGLSPITSILPPQSGASAQAQPITYDEIEKEAQSLQNEYESMQQKYKEAEIANPANKTKSRK